MHGKKQNKKLSRFILIGSFLLIIVGIGIISFKNYNNYQNKKIEEKKVNQFILHQIEIETIKDIDEEKLEIKVKKDSYIAVLDIPKINLKKGVYSKESSNNEVDKNVLLLKESDMPNIEKGNFMLAGHSGTGNNAHFRNLHKITYGDLAYLYYGRNKYAYKLVSKYEIIKKGEAIIYRNMNKKTLTLITCKNKSNKQIVFIFEIVNGGE